MQSPACPNCKAVMTYGTFSHDPMYKRLKAQTIFKGDPFFCSQCCDYIKGLFFLSVKYNKDIEYLFKYLYLDPLSGNRIDNVLLRFKGDLKNFTKDAVYVGKDYGPFVLILDDTGKPIELRGDCWKYFFESVSFYNKMQRPPVYYLREFDIKDQIKIGQNFLKWNKDPLYCMATIENIMAVHLLSDFLSQSSVSGSIPNIRAYTNFMYQDFLKEINREF